MVQNADVVLAADGRPFELLRREFPDLQILRMPGVSVNYGSQSNMMFTIAKQFPSILRAIADEHKALQPLLREHHLNAVISDNRFGLYSRLIPTAFLTHQIRILVPRPFHFLESPLALLNRFAINRFTQCWIPDIAGAANLSGILSHTPPLPKNAKFIGPLSRFHRMPKQDEAIDCVVVLSGPEPQRTMFESALMEQLKTLSVKSVVVRGIPERKQKMKMAENVTVISSLSSEELNKLVACASVVIARPGYSTLMDLAVLGKKALLIPTPGQTEQEYLGSDLMAKGICAIQAQKNLDVHNGMEQALHASGFTAIGAESPSLRSVLSSFLATV
jgi:UDP-N-acetylglucosamine transferase subunit ALG13